jgi:hypothetical protein
MDSLQFVFTLNFIIAVPYNSYFIIMGNGTSANLYKKDGYIELLLLENECYEQFHMPIGNKTSFEYNWVNKSIDGVTMTRYAGNCNITSFDYDGAVYNQACREYSHETIISQKDERIDLEYFICFLIPILLISRSDILINAIRKLKNAAAIEPQGDDDSSYVTMI